MLAQKDEYIQEASETIYQLSQEEMIRLQCEAREDYYRRQRDVEYRMQTLLDTNKELQDTNKELLATNAVLQAEIEQLKKLVPGQ